ncbi:MAG: Rne/Rng family ribonuclease [Acetobacteraceae bacterium]
MTKRMLIDATHAEETRVVVLDGNRLEDFDVETSTKKQIKGNIYLAKVVRVEPSLQAAFVEYGGGRHGFLSFDEIHPDYYQIPVADRQRLLALEAEEARREQEEEDARDEPAPPTVAARPDPEPAALAPPETEPHPAAEPESAPPAALMDAPPEVVGEQAAPVADPFSEPTAEAPDAAPPRAQPMAMAEDIRRGEPIDEADAAEAEADDSAPDEPAPDEPPPEVIGGEHDTSDDGSSRRVRSRFLRNYKIQEVIHRRQILLVQVEKEERGTKGAALTTYVSLAGRYSVLMPNSPRGGGVSRKITAPADRRRLKEVMAELDLPPGMGLIVRTAGANRPKPEIKRDAEYLLRLWDDIRERTLQSVAPALIHEEASLIKRAIRDVYSRDIDEIWVDGEDAWRAARDFMRMLMPAQARKVQLWRDPSAPPGTAGQPLFARHGVEAQLDAMLSPNVQLRSGGYLVINQAEALVAIDVNSGRSTRERGIEETALRTNLEAAEEVARQLRLRDLAGLIVIDFIDMESRRNNAQVEKRLKDALKTDRARIQLGHISHFGLLEMSRQRLRPSLAETSLVVCPHCAGTGHVRGTESAALHVLRAIEEEAGKHRAGAVTVHAALPIVLYILNHKRERLGEIERRHGISVAFARDDALIPPNVRIEKLRPWEPPAPGIAPPAPEAAPPDDDVAVEEEDVPSLADDAAPEADGAVEPAPGSAAAEDAERRRRRRRRRRGGPRPEEGASEAAAETHIEGVPEFAEPESAAPVTAEPAIAEPAAGEPAPAAADPDGEAANRRRGRRGGRRRRREEVAPEISAPGADQPDLPEVYIGPTPANPFGGQAFDIFDVLEQAEARALDSTPPAPPAPPESVPETHPEPAASEEPEPDATQEALEAAIAAELAPPAPAPEPPPPAPPAREEPVIGPAIQPVVIGADVEPPAAPRRGWWRRPG